MTVKVTADAAGAQLFLVKITGELKRPKALNDALGRRLARELQGHFRARNGEPNKLGGRKTNFWKQVADATLMTRADERGAEVTVAESRFRIHLFGGTIKPVKGKFLTIPMVKEAHGLRVGEYESRTGNKLFRLPGTFLLFERSDQGTSSLAGGAVGTVRRSGGNFGRVRVRARSLIRPVYALARQAIIKPDARALPPTERLAAALQGEADAWVARELAKPSNTGGNTLA